ncbi:ataxin-10-like [Tubulanus polymorphus]|uniref:ataxin-10-like n=1 Tax=Tubulanus polymorphus TaxID=672921 RepID=UPI003DA2A801
MLNFGDTGECQACLSKLESKINLFKTENGRSQLNECESLLNELSSIYESLIEFNGENKGSSIYRISIQILTEGFRALRNACAGCPQNQNLISQREKVLEHIRTLFLSLVEKDYTEMKDLVLSCLCCGVQFLGNFVTGSEQNQNIVWRFYLDLFNKFLSLENEKLNSYTCMVIYNCSTEEHRSELITTDDGQVLIKGILQSLMKHDSEWGLYIIQDLLQYCGFMEDTFHVLNNSEKFFLLEIMKAKVKEFAENEKETKLPFPVFCLSFILEQFKSKAHSILGLNKQKTDDESDSVVVVHLLDILCAATSRPSPYDKVKDDNDIVACCINLLKTVKDLGEQGCNEFTPVGKVADLGSVNTEHPVHGLKRDLIRLVSNLVYKHKKNQNMVRELEGIPIILNHTNIDGRNPFITQWCILAVRNLMDGNDDNKSYLNELKLEGVANNPELMTQFGVNAMKKDDKIVVQKVLK